MVVKYSDRSFKSIKKETTKNPATVAGFFVGDTRDTIRTCERKNSSSGIGK